MLSINSLLKKIANYISVNNPRGRSGVFQNTWFSGLLCLKGQGIPHDASVTGTLSAFR